MHRAPLLLALLLAALAVPAAPAAAAPPPIRHVFVVVLENKDAETTFGPGSPAPYLARELPRQGLFMPGYFGIGHASLTNYVAMVSGQAPNPDTQSDCQVFRDVLPGTIGADGQAVGSGCVYPAPVKTVADQLEAAGLTWKGYMEDMGADPARDGGTTCAHPALNAPDRSQSASPTDQYATRHNPFVYFHSLIDGPSCAANDVPLDRLAGDLQSAATTPNLAFITPDLCHDAHDGACADGGPGGLDAADAFLREWVPRITSSPAFADGLLVVTFDEAEDDSSACCGEVPGPGSPSPGFSGSGPGAGGGRVGAVLLSPYVAPGTTTAQEYNHYALLRSIEDLFGLEHLGMAARDGLRPFGDDVYTAPPAAPALAVDAPAPPAAKPACAPRSLAGQPRRLRAGTLLSGLRVRGRVVRFTATKGAKVVVRGRGLRRVLHVRACRAYRITLRVRAGARVTVTASSAAHAEHRAVRARRA